MSKQYVLILFSINLFFLQGNGQVTNSKFQKLFDLYVMDKYDACLDKALNYTESDKYNKEAEPYLYVTMCYLEIYLDDENEAYDEYEKPMKETLRYGAKFIRKDSKGNLASQNAEILSKVKVEAIKYANNFYRLSDYKQAVYYFKLIQKFDKTDDAIAFMLGVCQLLMHNEGEGSRNIEIVLDKITENENFMIKKETKSLFVQAFLDYSDYLQTKGEVEKVKSTMEIARKILPSSQEIQDEYKMVSDLEEKKKDSKN